MLKPLSKARDLDRSKITQGELFALCVARCLNACRKILAYTQEDLAAQTGMSQANWSKVERTGILSLEQLYNACETMGTSPFAIVEQAHTLFDGIMGRVLDITDGDVPAFFTWSKKNVAKWCDSTLASYYSAEEEPEVTVPMEPYTENPQPSSENSWRDRSERRVKRGTARKSYEEEMPPEEPKVTKKRKIVTRKHKPEIIHEESSVDFDLNSFKW